MADMLRRYGTAKGKQVFYATHVKNRKLKSKSSRRLP